MGEPVPLAHGGHPDFRASRAPNCWARTSRAAPRPGSGSTTNSHTRHCSGSPRAAASQSVLEARAVSEGPRAHLPSVATLLALLPLPLRQPTRLRAAGECVRLPCAVSPCGTRAGAGAHCGISAVRSLHSTDARASVSALAGQRVYRIAPGPAPPKYEPQPAGLRLEEWHPIGSAV